MQKESYIFETVEHDVKCPMNVFITSIELSNYHWHYDYEIVLVLKGSLLVSTSPKHFIMNAGDIYLINSKVVHELKQDDNENICLFIQLNPELFNEAKKDGEFYKFYLNSQDIKILPRNGIAFYIKLVAQIGLESGNDSIYGIYKTKALVYELIANLFENVVYDIYHNMMENAYEEGTELLMKIISYVEDNYKEEYVIEDLYRDMGIGDKTVYRFLKKQIGISLRDLVVVKRIDSAKYYLKYTKKTIDYIADDCGFGSKQTFYRTFKNSVGVAPVEYRRNGKVKEPNPVVNGYLRYSSDESKRLLLKTYRGEEI
ncbi:MAG TPA: AraC family transcriptional regulator [Epulopiscium sp.]|nr:AraC family transcriptional regulator [Candidatus Epulonipiscium sp.]